MRKTSVTFYTSAEERFLLLFVLIAASIGVIGMASAIWTLSGMAVRWIFWALMGVFLLLFAGGLHKLLLSFQPITMTLDECGIEISGADISKKIAWDDLAELRIAKVFLRRSLESSLLFCLQDGKSFNIVDRYTLSPIGLIAFVREFCLENQIHVGFETGLTS